MQFITVTSGNRKLDHRYRYLNRDFTPHKHRFRMTYYPRFFFVAFLCRDCDEIVLVERDIWNEMIRLGQDWRKLWRTR